MPVWQSLRCRLSSFLQRPIGVQTTKFIALLHSSSSDVFDPARLPRSPTTDHLPASDMRGKQERHIVVGGLLHQNATTSCEAAGCGESNVNSRVSCFLLVVMQVACDLSPWNTLTLLGVMHADLKLEQFEWIVFPSRLRFFVSHFIG